MIRIGIAGENYKNDALPIKALLDKRFSVKTTILPILKNTEGTKILNPRTAKLINDEAKRKNLSLIILAKDLDGFPSEAKKINAINQKSDALKKKLNISYILFIVVFELEALILADFATFKKMFSVKQNFNKAAINQSNPKELLKQLTAKTKRKYKESSALEIFQQLNFQKVYQNHNGKNSFQSFIDKLETILN